MKKEFNYLYVLDLLRTQIYEIKVERNNTTPISDMLKSIGVSDVYETLWSNTKLNFNKFEF